MGTKLRKELGLFTLIMIAIGSAIGSGIFASPGSIAKALPDSDLILVVWVLGGLIALCGAISFSELGGLFPSAGGIYNYLQESYGDRVAFLYGWSNLFVINTGSMAALSLVFGNYGGRLLGLPPDLYLPLGAVALVFLTIANLFGVKGSGRLADTFTLLKLVGIAFLILSGLFLADDIAIMYPGANVSRTLSWSDGATWLGIAAAMSGVSFSYGGWQHTSYLAGEAKRPGKDIPKAMIVGALVVIICYVLSNIAYLNMLTPAEMASTETAAADALGRTLGPWAATLISGFVALSVFGTISIFTMSAPRIYFRMAEDGLFFPQLAKLHPVWATPVRAMLVQSGWALVLMFFWGGFADVIEYVLIVDWLFLGLTGLAVIILRIKRNDALRPVRTLGYPFVPGFYVLCAFSLVGFAFYNKPVQALATGIVMVVGLLVFEGYKLMRK